VPPGSRPPGERRRSPRTPLRVSVDYRSVDRFLTEFSANLNEGGMFLEMARPAPRDSALELRFRLPGEEAPIAIHARVAWVSDGRGGTPRGVGVEFQGPDPAARETIARVVRSLRRGGTR
jgi:uncharacterized protein (TIGR02266 family)